MKKILNPQQSETVRDFAFLFFRMLVAFMLIKLHGFPKLEKLLADEPIQFFSVMGMSPELSISLAMFAELICSLFILLGFFTRVVAIPVIFTMLVIVFYIPDSFDLAKSELAIFYLISFILIFINGAGKHSLDTVLFKRMK